MTQTTKEPASKEPANIVTAKRHGRMKGKFLAWWVKRMRDFEKKNL